MILQLLLLINSVRSNQLVLDNDLVKIAEARCTTMNDWSHNEFFHTYAREIIKLGYVRAGENLALNFPDATSTFIGFQNSRTHKANNENKNYSKIGIANCNNQLGNVTVLEFGGKI